MNNLLEEESINSGFARFNTIITSLKALDEGFSSKNYVRKFLRALHPKWRAKVTTIEESKDLSSLALDELIGNLKVHEVVMEKDFEIYKGKKERVKSIALKAKKESSDDETSTSESDNKEYAMAVRKFKKCGDPNHLIGDCPKPSLNKDQKAFIGCSWSDSENDAEDKTNDETCLMAQSSNAVTLNSSYNSDDASSLDKDSMQIEIERENKKLKRSKEIEIACKSCEELKSENAKLKETQVNFVKFDKSANSIREMLNNQNSPSCKIGLGFDDSKVSTSGTKNMSLIGSSAEKAADGSTIKVHGSTLPGSVCLRTCLEPDGCIKDSGCSKHMSGKTPYEIFRGRKPSLEYFKVFGSKCFILNTKDYLTKFDPKSYEGVFLGYSQNSKAYVVLNKHTMKVEESLNVTFDESPPPTKLSPLVDDDVGEEEAIRKNTKIVNTNNEEDESIEVDEIVNIKESKNHPLDQVIGNLNQRTLRSQAQNHSNFFCFISTIEPKNVNEALKDESWVVAMQEELNQFVANDVWELVPLPISQSVIGTKWVFRNKLDENGIVSRNKARLVAQGYNQQEGIDYDETYAPITRLESIRILLAISYTNDFKLYQNGVESCFLNGF
ncbi:retrovirus-related pol polyprotein from transposon TNT 1-94 [Tanacetum coccineum]